MPLSKRFILQYLTKTWWSVLQNPSHLSHNSGLLTARVVLSELRHTRELYDNNWI